MQPLLKILRSDLRQVHESNRDSINMQYRDEDDEGEDDDFLGDGFITVGHLKEALNQVQNDDLKIYIERVDDLVFKTADFITKEIPDPKAPTEMVYRFVRCLEAVAIDTDDEKAGLYLTAFENR